MSADRIYTVKKGGKFFKGKGYCTGIPVRASWTHEPADAVVLTRSAAESRARELGGRVVVLEHLSPKPGAILYRLENDLLWDGEGGMRIAQKRFEVVRRTPRGAWAIRLHQMAPGRLIMPAWEKPRFILDGPGRRYAYVLPGDAMASFRARKESQVAHLEAQLVQAKAALEIIDRTDFEVDRTFYVKSLEKFVEY